MNPSPFTVEELRYLLRLIVDAQTSHAPEQWKPENPFRGHCIVVSLIVQDFFGGDLLCASLQGLRFEGSVILAGCHCWNHLPDGAEVDLTIEQFGEAKLDFPPPERRYRNYLLSMEYTKTRYELLRSRLDKILAGEDPFCASL
ncbi:MAG: hypothetical protein AAB673_03590 [Patescibacteria group bacterium]